MIFDVSAYLTNDTSINKEIKDYPKYISSGILLDEDILYLLIVGEFVNKQQNKRAYLLTEQIKFDLKDFDCLVQFLKGFHTELFITPPIFTKFIHLLWENINNEDDYKEIISIFGGISESIKEKHLDKKYFFDEEKFKTKKWDIINSSLILTSRNHNHNTIFTCKWKTNSICDKCGCLVIYYENVKSAYINNYFR
jgi:hypothetical protein